MTTPSTTAPTSWVGRPRILGHNETTRMLLLNTASIGLSFCWGTEMTYAAPYLLSLGLSKSKLSLVWIAGPLSGLIMQPLIGVVSDKWTSKYGRRRPFMLIGAALVAVCLVLLGWTGEIVGLFLGGGSAAPLDGGGGGAGKKGERLKAQEEMLRGWTVALAVLDIFVLDFVINISQTACQALVVDTLPVAKQQLGAAWSSRMSGVGHMLVYAIGALDLDSLFGGFLGDTQLKKVCLIAAIAMTVSQGITCFAVTERVLVADAKPSGGSSGISIRSVLYQIYATTRNVPERIQAICWVQFWSWIGWFAFLFYGSTWVGEIYLRHEAPQDVGKNKALNDVGRHGSMSFIIFSIVSFACAIVLPWFVRSPEDEENTTTISNGHLHRRNISTSSYTSYTPRPPPRLQSVLDNDKLRFLRRFRRPTLLTVWAFSNLVFAASMIFAPLVQSVRFATVLIAICALPRAVANWAPGAFLGVEVNRMSSGGGGSSSSSSSSGSSSLPPAASTPTVGGLGGGRLSASLGRFSIDSIELESGGGSGGTSTPKILHLRHDSNASIVPITTSTGELSGIYLGILNIYTTLPQFVGTAISWVVFSILEPGKSPELAQDADISDNLGKRTGVSGIGVCLFIGALCAVGAAWATRRLRPSTWQTF